MGPSCPGPKGQEAAPQGCGCPGVLTTFPNTGRQEGPAGPGSCSTWWGQPQPQPLGAVCPKLTHENRGVLTRQGGLHSSSGLAADGGPREEETRMKSCLPTPRPFQNGTATGSGAAVGLVVGNTVLRKAPHLLLLLVPFLHTGARLWGSSGGCQAAQLR